MVLMVSLLLIPALKLVKLEEDNNFTVFKFRGAVSELSSALTNYALEHGAYPLPAGPTLASTNANAFAPVTGTGIPAACGASSLAGTTGVICRPKLGTGTAIYIGTLPVTVLGLPPEKGLDAYGRKYTYAVVKSLTDAATFDDANGAIQIATETGTMIFDNAHFVVLSHGKDGNGAYNAAGSLIGSCPAATFAQRGNAFQCQQSSGLAGYFQKLYDTKGSTLVDGTNEAPGAKYFDDALNFNTTIFGKRMWTPKYATLYSVPEDFEAFTQGRNVGIGYPDGNTPPPQKLSVMTGNIKAKSAGTDPGNIITPLYCNTDGTKCFASKHVATLATNSPPLYCGTQYPLQSVMGTLSPVANCDSSPKITATTSSFSTCGYNYAYSKVVNGVLKCKTVP